MLQSSLTFNLKSLTRALNYYERWVWGGRERERERERAHAIHIEHS